MKALLPLALCAVALIAVRCGQNAAEPPPAALEQKTVAPGVQTFRELVAKLEAVTGISRRTGEVVQYFAGSQALLSMDGRIDRISPPMLLATVSLAGLFCEKFVLKEKGLPPAERLLHADVNLAGKPEAFTPERRRKLVTAYAERFWLRAPADAEADELMDLLARVEETAENPARTVEQMSTALCTAVASSWDSIRI